MKGRQGAPIVKGMDGVAKLAAKVGVTLIALAAAVYFLAEIRVALVLTLAAAMLACSLHHGVDFLQRRRMGRKLAIVTVLGASLVVFATLFFLVVPPAVGQAKSLAARGPELQQRVQQTRAYQELDRRFDLQHQLERLRSEAPARASAAVQPGLRVLRGAVFALGAVVAVGVISVFMLFFGERLVQALLDEALPDRRERYRRVLHKIYRALGGYLSGLTVICGCNAVCTTTFLAIARVPFFLPLGILAGLSSLVPLVGHTVTGLLITLLALATGGVPRALACAAYVLLYQQFENHVVGPLVYRRTVDVNPLISVVGLLAFAELGGVVGAVLAVPVIASAQIVTREVLRHRRELLNAPPKGPVEEGAPLVHLIQEPPQAPA